MRDYLVRMFAHIEREWAARGRIPTIRILSDIRDAAQDKVSQTGGGSIEGRAFSLFADSLDELILAESECRAATLEEDFGKQ